jgi:4-amino-4-deoxy-L-arabinose transferase-like glycosyltransferase
MLVLPVFFIALLMYGKRTAYISAILIAFQPVLVKLGGSTYNEAIYLTFFMTGIWSGLRALELNDKKFHLVTGTSFGLAALARPEAFAYPLFFVISIYAVAVFQKKPFAQANLAAAFIMGSFGLLIAPYAAYLYVHTGSVRLEGKWDINYTIGNRLQENMDYSHAAYGVGKDFHTSGPLLDPDEFAAYTPFPHSWHDSLRYLFRQPAINRFDVYHQFESYMLGDPIVFVLAIIGLFRKAWSVDRLRHELVLLTMALSLLILMFTAQHIERRYAFPLIPLLTLWAAKGIDEVGQWTRSLIAAWTTTARPLRLAVVLGVQTVAVGSLLLIALHGSRELREFQVEQGTDLPTKRAALWLEKHSPGPKRVLSWDARFSWYADAAYLQFPNADPATTLRYIAAEKPDFIFLGAHYIAPAPTTEEWLAHGIPDSRAHLIYSSYGDNGRLLIYEWLPSKSLRKSHIQLSRVHF